MPEHIRKIAKQLNSFMVSLAQMRENNSPATAVKAFFDIGCHFYGKSNIIEYADGIGETEVLQNLI